jgi:hypothetical protein
VPGAPSFRVLCERWRPSIGNTDRYLIKAPSFSSPLAESRLGEPTLSQETAKGWGTLDERMGHACANSFLSRFTLSSDTLPWQKGRPVPRGEGYPWDHPFIRRSHDSENRPVLAHNGCDSVGRDNEFPGARRIDPSCQGRHHQRRSAGPRTPSSKPDFATRYRSAAARSRRAGFTAAGTLRSGQPALPAIPHCARVHRALWAYPGRL